MADTTIPYFLPITVVRLAGTRTVTQDPYAPTPPAYDATSSLVVQADPSASSQVQVHQGWFRQTQVSLTLTDDGRLTSASAQSTGEAATVLKDVVTTAATVAGLVVHRFTEATHQDAGSAYAAAHPDEAERLKDYLASNTTIEKTLSDLLGRMSTAIPSRDQVAELHRLKEARAEVQAELASYRAKLIAWKAAQVSTTVENHSYDVPLDVARKVVVKGGVVTGLEGAAARAWDGLGITVTVSHEPAAPGTPSLEAFRGVHVRTPRYVQMTTWHRHGDTAVMGRTERVLVVDDRSAVQELDFRTSAWNKRKTAITMSAAGGLAGYDYSGDAGAAADALAGVPGEVASGLESATKLHNDVETVHNADQADLLAQLKQATAILEAKQALAKGQKIDLDALATSPRG